ncbi:GNAT family N-acetyltransferase, partial [Enterobacter hormaechei]|nr:GNAT family N-acetyltransferase [Enterobacter hormaechei]
PPQVSDYRAWANLRATSRDFLAPWEPLWADDDLERSAFRHRIRHYDDEAAAGTAHPFFLFHNSDSRLLGGITLGNIRRGVGQNGMIGYWMGAPYAGQGYMSEALRLLISHAFTKVRLHRLEAACIPSNE